MRSTVSLESSWLYAWVDSCESIGTFPGLVELGPAAIGEGAGLTVPKVRKALEELRQAGWLLYDLNARIIFVTHAVGDDPAANPNVASAWASRFQELPPGPVTDAIRAAVEAALTTPSVLAAWTNGITNGQPNHSANGSTNHSLSLQSRAVPEQPQQPLTPAEAELADAWSRLPSPPFAAAAADDFRRVLKELGRERFGLLVDELSRSKWLDSEHYGLTGGTPTLRDLLAKPDKVASIIGKQFTQTGLIVTCHVCKTSHALLEACKTEQPCGRLHRPGAPCHLCKQRESDFEDERQYEEANRAEAERRGISIDALAREQSKERLAGLRRLSSPSAAASR